MALCHTLMVSISFLYLLIITPPHICFAAAASKKRTGFSLKLIHRDSPESPLYPGNNLTFHEKMSRYEKWSDARASYLSSIVTRNATPASMLRPEVYADGNYFMVKLAIGTPPKDIMLLLDTGAGLSWTQCLPCETCFYQKNGIYNPSASRTYQLLPCTHPLCSDVLECTANHCMYDMHYGGGGPRTTGVAMTETLTFRTDNGHRMVINNFVIGCSRYSVNFPFGSGNIGGILGMTPSPHSFATQLDGIIERKFSYCLTRDPTQYTNLRFGSDIVVRGIGPVQTTPFIRLGNGAYHFGLDLQDISIAGVPIGYPEGTFAPRAGGGGGCFIDSGAPLTLIEQAPFNTFIAAFENYFAPNKPVRNTRDCTSPSTYCYFAQGITKPFPHIMLHFQGGATYTLPPGNVIAADHTGTYFMLMIQPSFVTVLGAWQQYNMRLVYDLNEGNLSFVLENCYLDGGN